MEKIVKKENSIYNRVAEYIYSVLSYLLICMLAVFVAFTFFFRLAVVDGVSMYPTLTTGDRIIISNFLYSPDYGDIIAINKESADESSMIKRVIGLPGDTVSINFETHLITVNGKVIYEDYQLKDPISEAYDMDFPIATVTVPEASVFVLGDNRNNSIDSRHDEVGFIRLDEINGKALVKIYPAGKIR